ncbi:Caspase domain, partial [Rhizoctonia solani]
MTLTATQSTSRGAQELPVATPSSPDRREIVAFIKHAISDGDLLPNTSDIKPARRRALIIAPQYREPGQTFGALPSTAADVKLVYELLIRSGYDRRNIRILCDVWSFNGRAHPTRENILHSLDWLVAGATKGDFRFLHFSGHGTQITTDSSKGKESRILNSNSWLKIPGGWDTELSPSTMLGERITEQIITEAELVYYNEAIVTRISEEMDPDLDPEGNEDLDSIGRIWDRELNEYISKLPEGCTITCIMDCCSSGRILSTSWEYDLVQLLKLSLRLVDLSRKLQGSGFRGKSTQATTERPPLYIPSLPSFNPTTENTTSLPSPSLLSPTIPSISAIASTVVNVLPQMVRYARIAMQEGIPDRERDMDRIRARIFAWSACHQRQLSWDSNDCQNGLLTRTFTETCLRLGTTAESPTRFTYNTLFEEVSKLVAESRATSLDPVPQFVQLWTSLREENRLIEVPSGP